MINNDEIEELHNDWSDAFFDESEAMEPEHWAASHSNEQPNMGGENHEI